MTKEMTYSHQRSLLTNQSVNLETSHHMSRSFETFSISDPSEDVKKNSAKRVIKEMIKEFLSQKSDRQVVFKNRRSLSGAWEIYDIKTKGAYFYDPINKKKLVSHPKDVKNSIKSTLISPRSDGFRSNLSKAITLYNTGIFKEAHAILLQEANGLIDDAFAYLGRMHEYGYHVTQDSKIAVLNYEKAVECGSGIGMYFYALFLIKQQNYALAEEILIKGTIKHNHESMNRLGQLYLNGNNGIQKNINKAKALIEQAALLENPEALFTMSIWCNDGFHDLIKKSVSKHKEYLRKAVDKGYPDALYIQGKDFYKQKKYPEALKLFQSAAAKDNPDSKVYVGFFHQNGLGGLSKDLVKAKSLYEEAANFPHYNHIGMLHLGKLYRDGLGVDQDYGKAAKLFSESKRKGNNDAGMAWKDLFVNRKISPQCKIDEISRESTNGNKENTVTVSYSYDKDVPFTPDFRIYRNGEKIKDLKDSFTENKFSDTLPQRGTYIYQIAMLLFDVETRKSQDFSHNHTYSQDSQKQHRNVREKYVKIKKIKSGGQGKLWLCNDSRMRTLIMKIRHDLEDIDAANDALREAFVPLAFTHPNLVRPIDVFMDTIEEDFEIKIIMEYYQNGDLKDYMNKNNTISTHNLLDWALEIVSGIQYLHEKQFIHRDLKPENVLINSDKNCVITDFGSMRNAETQSGLTKCIGTFYYMSPEIKRSNGNITDYSYPTDMYSFGMILYYMWARKHPVFDQYTDMKTEIEAVFREIKPMAKLVLQLVAKEPQDRPDAKTCKIILEQVKSQL